MYFRYFTNSNCFSVVVFTAVMYSDTFLTAFAEVVIGLTRPELKFFQVISGSFNKSLLKEQLKFCGTNRRRAPDVTDCKKNTEWS